MLSSLLETVSQSLGSYRLKTIDQVVDEAEALRPIVDGFKNLLDEEIHAN
jgi:hypothetical protein